MIMMCKHDEHDPEQDEPGDWITAAELRWFMKWCMIVAVVATAALIITMVMG